MSDRDLPALDADIDALVRRAAAIDVAPADARARVAAHLAVHLGMGTMGGGGDGSAPSGGVGGATGSSASGAPRLFDAGSRSLLRRAWPLALTFAVGGGAGATAMHAAMTRRQDGEPQTRIVYRERERSPAPPAAPVAAAAPARPCSLGRSRAPSPTQASTTTPSWPSPHADVAARHPAGPSEQLARERTLLDAARGALEREDPTAALAATEQHRQGYPKGILAQERVAMAVRALGVRGRADGASARDQAISRDLSGQRALARARVRGRRGARQRRRAVTPAREAGGLRAGVAVWEPLPEKRRSR